MNLHQLDRKGLPKPPWQVKRNKAKSLVWLQNHETKKQYFVGPDTKEHRAMLSRKAHGLNTDWFITSFVGPN